MIPASIACAYAFMLPVATPPNAIAFSYGHMKVIDMVSDLENKRRQFGFAVVCCLVIVRRVHAFDPHLISGSTF